MTLRTSISSIAFAALVLSACDGESEPSVCDPREATVVDSAGTEYRYVIRTIELPNSRTRGQEIALDLDENTYVDNVIGSNVFGLIGEYSDDDLSAEANALVESGELLQLIDVRATSLDEASGVGVRVAVARDLDDDPSDNHSGQEALDIDSSVEVGQMSGELRGGHLSVDLGTAPLALTFPGLGERFIFSLSGARLEATITEEGIQGTIAGGIPFEEVDRSILPALELGFARVLARDCPGQECVPDSFGEVLLHFFDTDGDYLLPQDELRENSLIGAILRPDLDLYNENGDFAPKCDGTRESLSLAVGFTAVRAEFPGI